MVVRCPGCEASYRLEVARLPEGGARVRCPRCGSVFRLSHGPGVTRPAAPSQRPSRAPVQQPREDDLGIERDLRQPPRFGRTPRATPRPEVEPAKRTRPAWSSDRERTLDFDTAPAAAPPPPPRLETAPFRPDALAEVSTVEATRVETPTAPPVRESDPGRDRARRLARVLVSDILVYNRDVRDRALVEGNLALALGTEINKAWELYKSKVGAEVVGSSTFFKDALNEILAEGAAIF